VPFSSYETNLVSDPLTLEIGETRETSVLVGYEAAGFAVGGYIFNGDSNDGDDNTIDNFGVVAGYGQESEDFAFGVNVGYINHIGDSDTLQDTAPDVADYVPGWTFDGIFAMGPFTVIGEYTMAADSFEAGEPRAWNIEGAYAFELADMPASFAIGYQGTDEALALELPETRVAAALSVEIYDATALSFEWAHDEDYDESDGGTGNSADTATLQLAVEF
jgi:hypothetical protein